MRALIGPLVLTLGLTCSPAALAQTPAPAAQAQAPPASVTLPPELDRVLRDYESRFGARDAIGLSRLFVDDGWVLSSGRPPIRGRDAIAAHYATSGGVLRLRALTWAADGRTGFIVGAYAFGTGTPDDGKFTLTLKKVDGRWLIVSDMDNGNRPQ